METRENEVHEAFIDVFKSISGDICVQTSCNVCGRLLYDTNWWSRVTEEQLTERAKEATPNYCPNCGARLKEVEK